MKLGTRKSQDEYELILKQGDDEAIRLTSPSLIQGLIPLLVMLHNQQQELTKVKETIEGYKHALDKLKGL